jgi:hypothetical protein
MMHYLSSTSIDWVLEAKADRERAMLNVRKVLQKTD